MFCRKIEGILVLSYDQKLKGYHVNNDFTTRLWSRLYCTCKIYPPELQLNKANTSDTEAPFLDLHLSISNGFVSSKIYDKLDD